MDSYVGKRIDGRYEIREIVGVGGMAVVYKAYDNIDDRIVAVKILKEEFLANEEFRRRFKNESKAIAVLSHQNIVKVFDVSFGDRLQYIVMEYVEGITLKEYIGQQGVINCKEVVHFTTQILRALQHAHDKGIVHRDIKPQNIMLLQNGNIKVTDFGIARFSRGETRTLTESTLGSVHYVSPEQARGEQTDEKTDIYSVGVLMYEMLTGQLPFQSDSALSVALMQVQEEATPPTAINGDIPTGLEQITLKAMQKNLKERYQSAAEMLLDIEEYKRNPAVVFDYSYFVDSNPTKHISSEEVKAFTNDVGIKEVDPIPEEEINEYVKRGTKSKKKKKSPLPVIVGALSAVLIVLLCAVGYMFFKEDLKGIFALNHTVPNFVGLNYYDEIQGRKEYKYFELSVVDTESSEYDEGIVIEQSVKDGEKIKSGSTITLNVAVKASGILVPDVVDYTLFDAEELLSNKGLNVIIEYEKSETVDEGKVIRTEPINGSTLMDGDDITIFISKGDESGKVTVPDIANKLPEMAKYDLEAVGLKLDTSYAEETSPTVKKGYIISSNPAIGSSVSEGTTVKVTVSLGQSAGSKDVTVKLPSSGSGSVVYKVNGNTVNTLSSYNFFGQNYFYTVTGVGNNDKVEVYVNDNLYFSCYIDFTSNPVRVKSYTDHTGTVDYSSIY